MIYKNCKYCKNRKNDGRCKETKIPIDEPRTIFVDMLVPPNDFNCGKFSQLENICNECKNKLDNVCTAKFSWNNISYIKKPEGKEVKCEKHERK